jgi:hypothetical protein
MFPVQGFLITLPVKNANWNNENQCPIFIKVRWKWIFIENSHDHERVDN